MSVAPWYRLRKYPHFDLPTPELEAIKLATSAHSVARHAFWPFIAFDLEKRRYKARNNVGVVSIKKRPIRIASHRDGYIFAYYAWLLAKHYEDRIAGTPLSSSVLAYRRGIGSSMDFAFAAFEEIAKREECVAFALDLEGFFDSIDHAILKDQWSKTLKVKRLPTDVFAVFKAVTRYATVDKDECFKALDIDPKKKKPIPRPICATSDFHTKIRKAGLVEVHKDTFGIPQGSPISAILSNVYMMPFDEKMSTWAKTVGAYYRRYCDDILILVSPDFRHLVLPKIAEALLEQGTHLQVNNSKTTQTHFVGGEILSGPLLQYLGFTFNGSAILIRSQTMSKFWRRAIYGVRAAKGRAKKASKKGGNPILFKRKLYRRFSHLGKRNFFTYAKRAWKISGDENIRRQLRRHWPRLHKEIRR